MYEKQYLKDKKLYNKQLKERYLNSLENQIAKVLEYIFFKSSDLEYQYDKDIANFSSSQFEEFLTYLNRKSIASLTTSLSLTKSYIDFAIKEGYVNSFLNIAETFNRENSKKYVNQIVLDNKYINEEIYNDLVNSLINAQDAAIFALLWEGAKGEGYEELINLKQKGDIDEINNKVTLTKNNGSKRKIEVCSKTIDILTDAIVETVYNKDNGENENSRKSSMHLAETKYVLRPSGKNKTDKIISQNINARLKRMAKWYGNPYLTPTSVWESGMRHYAQQLLNKNNGELSEVDYEKIHKKFGLNSNSTLERTKIRVRDFI